jgi:tetratricopeptide (TPR) repeat protein/DNA-binding XRE family transcriptional regulator
VEVYMRREHFKARLLRALSGKTQERIAEEIESHSSLISQIELGQVLPRPDDLARMARSTSLTVDDTDEILDLADTLRRTNQRRVRSAEGLADLEAALCDHIARARRRLLALPGSDRFPQVERGDARALWRVHVWACVQLCEESAEAASRQVEAAATLVRVAREIAGKVPGPEGIRLQGQVVAYEANVLRVTGELPAADTFFEESERLWQAGKDVSGLLDPGRRLDLKASLRRDQRRFEAALDLLTEAEKVGWSRARVLIKKGFTLEVMGEYERAVEALLEAEPLLDRKAEPHLWLNQRLNRAVNCTHLGCYREAAELVEEAQPLIAALGADLVAVRVTWLQGRIAAGLGRSQEARELLEKARREFASRNMSYDVALALLEESVLLLNDGRTAEVKTLARELATVFESKGVHREALAALRLFQEAAEGERATAELARRLLRYLFRARHDQGLPFTVS